MAEQTQSTEPNQASSKQPEGKKPAKFEPPPDTVRVRLRTGTMTVDRVKDDKTGQILSERTLKVGDEFDMPRAEAEKLLKRKFEGYPTNVNPNTGAIAIAQWPNIVHDSPIELVGPTL